ncbi:MAG: hypothetical protein ACO271_09200, partial [Burkholderiales bacterium]
MKRQATLMIAALTAAFPAIAQTENTGQALTIYSTARPGALSPELYRGGAGGPAVPGYAVVRQQRDLALVRGRNNV